MKRQHHRLALALLPFLLTPAVALADGETEVRVYLANRDRKPVDLRGIKATLIVEPAGGKRRVVPLSAVTPAGKGQRSFEHGGEVRPAGDYLVELVVQTPPAEPAGHGGGGHGHGGHGHGDGGNHGGHGDGGHDGHGGSAHGGQPDEVTPYFRGQVDLRGYSCGMAGHPVTDRAGRCAKCGMELRAIQREFSAVVVLRVGGRTVNAQGFRHPSDTPTSYADGLEKIQTHIETINGLIEANQLLRVHPVAERISRVCKKLPDFAPKGAEPAVRTTCTAVVALFKDIDEAADSQRRAETVAVLDRYKARLAEFKRHLPAR